MLHKKRERSRKRNIIVIHVITGIMKPRLNKHPKWHIIYVVLTCVKLPTCYALYCHSLPHVAKSVVIHDALVLFAHVVRVGSDIAYVRACVRMCLRAKRYLCSWKR